MIVVDDEFVFLLNQKENQNIELEDRLLKKLKIRLKEIEIIILDDDIKEQPVYINDDIKNSKQIYNLKNLTTEKLIERVLNKELRYSEQNNDDRFLFYSDLEKELRSIIVGTSNFLLIRGVFSKGKYQMLLDDYYFDNDYMESLFTHEISLINNSWFFFIKNVLSQLWPKTLTERWSFVLKKG